MQYIGFKHCHGILRQRNGELPNDRNEMPQAISISV